MNGKKKKALKVGQLGELVAADFLIGQRYVLLKQNVRYKTGEIDLVMKHPKGHICFVEVKTASVSGSEFQDKESAMEKPIEQLHKKKIHKLHKAITSYLQHANKTDESWQLDAVVVLLDSEGNNAYCKHIEHISPE